MGLVIRGTISDWRVDTFRYFLLTCGERRGFGDGVQSPKARSYISHDYIENLHRALRGLGSELLRLVSRWRLGRGACLERSWTFCAFSPYLVLFIWLFLSYIIL